MPPKSQGEIVKELELAVAVLRRDVERVDVGLEKADLFSLKAEVAVLRHIVDDMKKKSEEDDRRRWQIIAAGISSVFALVVNLVLLVARK